MNPPVNQTPPPIKVGRWTSAIGLIGVGVIVLLQFNNIISSEALKYVWPMLLILLGVEVVIANIIHSERRVRLGGFSVTILILLLLVSTVQTVLPDLGGLFNRGYVGAVQGQTEVGSGIKRVEIKVDHGKVNVTGTEDAKLTYDGKFRFRDAKNQEDADRKAKERWKVSPSGDTLVLSLEDNPGVLFQIGFFPDEEYVNVSVPKSLEVEVRTKNDSVIGKQLDAGFTAVTTNSSITLEQVKGNVSASTTNGAVRVADIGGSAQLKSTNGSLTIDRVAGEVTAKTTNGAIRGTSAIGGDWTCSSTNGSINLKVPENASAEIKAKTSNSSIGGSIAWAEDGGDNRKRAMIGDGSHHVELTTSNGSIKVNYEN
ncbi:DUF4097 family beta strand repeat-containing protein [Paenibacillus sp. VCA1]|uniref:DUF4097 family beta strand repeat-containing protein n=1 Tax=Paenibacillus sp. VCA1 TaxID=3039148 RepID=UPI002871F996|nr:DUF4097 family beta strand repeat-containing protein [Paenibacillus sp. VCA1]MDR9853430.1 DUF4097 family beta strand repeat-containing protein [Paenibacillus sp. VCA1]